ncbi:MAG: hypothetical protein MR598_03845 [Erysipelotrichaceae bacterium]|nr:hypothetical protein [Erysipelotrichaceae bacterium]
MSIIKEEQIIGKIEKMKAATDNLSESVTEFTDYVKQISEVIEGLKVYFNTTSGIETVNDISNLDFDLNFLNSISKEVNDIEVRYYKEKKNLY